MSFMTPLRLRAATVADIQLLWEWVNDPVTRQMSFASKTIPWAEHCSWLHARLADPTSLLFVASTAAEIPVGQARYDLQGDGFLIDVSVDPAHRRQGIGSRIIAQASQEVFARTSICAIYAYIKPFNKASLRAFRRAGFLEDGEDMVQGQQARRLVLRRAEASSSTDLLPGDSQ
ncbi:MAG: GNAT family N-acetyltransferase [Chloroflexi bacterium]|nr:GNAT family N-acetyltransferase [Chloroflexota bacterium]